MNNGYQKWLETIKRMFWLGSPQGVKMLQNEPHWISNTVILEFPIPLEISCHHGFSNTVSTIGILMRVTLLSHENSNGTWIPDYI